MITFTFDLEDHRSDLKYEKRYPQITRNVLEFLRQSEIRGTFFVVGEVAEDEPELLRDIAAEGHELAFHSQEHLPLHKETPGNFRQQTADGKKLLEDTTGMEIKGYRAPVFSMSKDTLWCLDELRQLGFTYSSSVLPASNPLFGMPRAPREPFYWPTS